MLPEKKSEKKSEKKTEKKSEKKSIGSVAAADAGYKGEVTTVFVVFFTSLLYSIIELNWM